MFDQIHFIAVRTLTGYRPDFGTLGHRLRTDPMTWTIAHTQTWTTGNTVATGLGPWEYHFETFLPSRGWTITEDEDGGIGTAGVMGSNASSKFYAVEKTFTNAAGATVDMKYIVELIFNYRYVAYYTWTGVAGEGASTSSVYTQTNNYSIGQSGTSTYRWLQSDENQDSWMMCRGSDSLTAFSFPMSQAFVDFDVSMTPSLTCQNANHMWWDASNLPIYANLGGSSIMSASYILTPNFAWAKGSGNLTIALNDQQDILLKINGTNSGSESTTFSSGASLQIGAKYYFDLAPSSVTSLILDTGLVDFGAFA